MEVRVLDRGHGLGDQVVEQVRVLGGEGPLASGPARSRRGAARVPLVPSRAFSEIAMPCAPGGGGPGHLAIGGVLGFARELLGGRERGVRARAPVAPRSPPRASSRRAGRRGRRRPRTPARRSPPPGRRPLAVEPAAPTPRRRGGWPSPARGAGARPRRSCASSCSDMRLNSRPSCANSSSPVTGHGLVEAPAGQPARRLEELADLLLQGARDEHRAGQRQHEEGQQQRDHEQAVLRDRVVQLGGIGEDHELLGAGDLLPPAPVLVAPRLEVARALRGRAHGGHGGGHRAAAPQHEQLLPAAPADRARQSPRRR